MIKLDRSLAEKSYKKGVKKSPQSRSKKKNGLKLEKHDGNPVIAPVAANDWETKATFNPAAVEVSGKVYMAYRAIGEADRSVLGYAASEDGLFFDERDDLPMYIPRADFEGSIPPEFRGKHYTADSPYVSGGGGWGGVEDPRLTVIGDRVYMTYVAYDGWRPPRVALSSISLDNFLLKVWEWTQPVLISPPHIVNKNAVIFPEKVNGKYVIFHRVYPDILIDFVDDLEAFDGQTVWLKGEYRIRPRKDYWDSKKVGAGPPPIKTEHGWLLIYQAVGYQDPGRYKIGAMLLDLDDPTKVIARSDQPILEPEEWYENDGWKAGVAYPCGAVIKDGKLIVYYGGADTVVCSASADLKIFVKQLMTTKKPKLNGIKSAVWEVLRKLSK